MTLVCLGAVLIGKAVIDISKADITWHETSITVTAVIILVFLFILIMRLRIKRAKFLEEEAQLEKDLRQFMALTNELRKIVDIQQKQLKFWRNQERRHSTPPIRPCSDTLPRHYQSAVEARSMVWINTDPLSASRITVIPTPPRSGKVNDCII